MSYGGDEWTAREEARRREVQRTLDEYWRKTMEIARGARVAAPPAAPPAAPSRPSGPHDPELRRARPEFRMRGEVRLRNIFEAREEDS